MEPSAPAYENAWGAHWPLSSQDRCEESSEKGGAPGAVVAVLALAVELIIAPLAGVGAPVGGGPRAVAVLLARLVARALVRLRHRWWWCAKVAPSQRRSLFLPAAALPAMQRPQQCAASVPIGTCRALNEKSEEDDVLMKFIDSSLLILCAVSVGNVYVVA